MSNLTTAKTFRQYAAVEGVNHPPIHALFQHDVPDGDIPKPTDAQNFTAVAATNLLTTPAHGLVVDTPLRFASTTTLPGGLAVGTTAYVISSGLTANDYKVSATIGGTEIDITSAGTGTHSWTRYLTGDEQAQVNSWLQTGNDSMVSAASAILMIAAWKAYNKNPIHLAWVIDDHLARHWQWIYRSADHADLQQPAIPPSSVDSGTGSGSPSSPVAQSPN